MRVSPITGFRWIGVSDSVELRDGDLSDMSSLTGIVQDVKPDEVYNLAAQSFVYSSWQTADSDSKYHGGGRDECS
jgi:GDP-D-mannose dehydratase